MSKFTRWLAVGSILLRRKFITQDQLDHALEQQEAAGGKLGEVLVNMGFVERSDVEAALRYQESLQVGLESNADDALDETVKKAKQHHSSTTSTFRAVTDADLGR